MNYWLAGYYLIKLRPLFFGSLKSKVVYTCSSCINDSLLDDFSRSWTRQKNDINSGETGLKIDPELIAQVHEWTNRMDAEQRIGYIDVFYDIKTAKEYKSKFFPDEDNVKLLALYLPEAEAEELIKEFSPKKENEGEIGIVHKLKQKEMNPDSTNVIGYDLIGVESGGSFHSFHCHDMDLELNEKFGVKLNDYGLLENDGKWKGLADYMNCDAGGEPVPWYFAQVRLIE